MKQTSKYQLNLIENSDRFLAEPINENTQALEDALLSHNVDSNAHSALQTATNSHIADKSNPHGVTAAQVGAAASSHNHSASNITSGTLPTVRGGTGNTSVDTTPTSGSTKMVTSGGIFTALAGKSDTSHTHSTYATTYHNHDAGNIISGILPVTCGGTGNTSVDTTPTSGSTRMVTSGGVYNAVASKFGADNLPWVTGSYVGTGGAGSQQVIELGFSPSAVIIVCDSSCNTPRFGAAIRHGAAFGSTSTVQNGSNFSIIMDSNTINITSSGFMVIKENTTYNYTMNESNTTYHYIAFK